MMIAFAETTAMISSALPCDLVRAIAAAATATASLLALSTPPEGVVSMGLGEAAPEAGVDPDPTWGCCSCWALAAAALFSCAHRMALQCEHVTMCIFSTLCCTYLLNIIYFVMYTYIYIIHLCFFNIICCIYYIYNVGNHNTMFNRPCWQRPSLRYIRAGALLSVSCPRSTFIHYGTGSTTHEQGHILIHAARIPQCSTTLLAASTSRQKMCKAA